MDAAENKALSDDDFSENELKDYLYYNSKEMKVLDTNETPKPTEKPVVNEIDQLKAKKSAQRHIYLKTSKKFFNQAVNTSLSSVHVPTNVYDRGKF